MNIFTSSLSNLSIGIEDSNTNISLSTTCDLPSLLKMFTHLFEHSNACKEAIFGMDLYTDASLLS